MKSIICIFKLLLIFAVIITLFPGIAESGEEDAVTNFYRDCIVNEIDKCNANAKLCESSKSSNLRNYGELKKQKSVFLINKREALVQKMLDLDIAPKRHKVQVFINATFHNEHLSK